MFGYAKYVVFPPMPANSMKKANLFEGCKLNLQERAPISKRICSKGRKTKSQLREFQTSHALLDHMTKPFFISDNGGRRKKDDLYFEFLLKMYGYEVCALPPLTHIPARGMKKPNLCFLDVLRDFLYTTLGMKSMRLPSLV